MKDSCRDMSRPLARDTTIPELFAEQVAEDPHACALIQGARRLSYRELDQASDKVARLLLDRGVASGECVLAHAGRTIEMVVASLGILKAGACYVPLDPALPADRKQFVRDDTRARVVLSEHALDRAGNPWAAGTQPYLIEDIWCSTHARSTQLPRPGSRSLAYVMYTSGSTGKPKGVLIEHRSVARLVKDNDYVPLERHDRLLLTGAIGFDMTTFEIWGSLLNGLSLYLVDPATLNDGRTLKEALEKWGITTLSTTTTFCSRLAQEDPTLFRSLKYLLIAGEVLKPKLSNTIRRASPGLRVINGYGPTESTTFATTFEIDAEYSSSIPIGKPIRGTAAFIVNEDLVPLADGSIGEIVLAGDGLASGYLNSPELTRARFLEIPGLGRVYRTGDLGRRQEDGNIQFIGRNDRQVKIGGYRVELGEIEHALSSIDAVRDCTVRVLERNGERFLAAYYVSTPPGIEGAALRQRLAAMMPEHLLPAFFIEIDALPLDPHGKIDQKALPDPFEDGAGVPAQHSDVQARVTRIWEKVLEVRDPDVDADFFEIGGSSIKAIHVLGGMAAQGFDVSVSDIAHHRTIRKLSAYVASTLKRGGLLKSWPAATSRLRERFPGSEWTPSVYSVGEEGAQAREIVVLHYRNVPVSEPEILDALTSSVSAELFPHYIHAGDAPEGAGPTPISGARLSELLGLRGVCELHLDELKARVLRDYQRNDRVIQDGLIVEECPFSPIQELQFSFRTPMSYGHFILDRPVNLASLERAVCAVIEEQDLLTSTPIEKAGQHAWRKFAVRGAEVPGPSIVDLSAYYCDDAEFVALVREVLSAFDLWGAHVLYHVLIIKRNAREHVIVLVFNHVLFDRVSEEVIRRQVLTRYDELLERRESPPGMELVHSTSEQSAFFAYVRQVRRGPADISASDLVQHFALREFHAQKRKLLTASGLEPIDQSYSFQIAVPQPAHLESGHSLGLALALYVKALGAVCGVDSLPVLFIYDGRNYRGTGYYNIVGECIDYVPIVLETHLSAVELQHVVKARLAVLSAHNVNFLNLVNNPQLSEEWRGIRELIDPGPGYANLDLCMFNYLGNRPGKESYQRHQDLRIHAGRNPLPLHSFLNCITSSYSDGLIFNLRTSYACDVEDLRAAFEAASRSL